MLILVFSFALLAFTLWFKTRSKLTGKSPPGPPAIPILGHLHLLMKSGTHPHTLFQALGRRYGPVFSLQFGTVPLVVATTAAAAKEFLKTHDATFASRPDVASGRIITYNHHDIVFNTYGDQWRQLRRLVVTELFNPRRIEMFKDARAVELKNLSDSLVESAGKLVDVRQLLKTVTFNITTFMLMRKRYLGRNVENPEEATKFVHVIDDICDVMGMFPIGDYLPFLRLVDPVEYRMRKISKDVDEFLDARIAEHEKNKPVSRDGMDFVDILLELREKGEEHLQKNTIKGMMTNLLAAGTDTSSVTVEWAMAELMQHPEFMSKAREEIERVVGRDRMVSESDLPQLHYIQAIVKETFRFHPPTPLLVPHSSTQDCTVMGYHVPGNSTLLVNVYAIGRDGELWDKPLEFNPDRFVGSEMDFRGRDYELIPFGSGRRMCPGLNLAWITVHLSLATLVHGFEWEGTVDTVAEHYGLDLLMAKKLEAVPRMRLSPHAYNAL